MLPTLFPGQVADFNDINRIIQAVNRSMKPVSAGNVEFAQGPYGMTAYDYGRTGHWAMIGAASSGNKYAHTRVETPASDENPELTGDAFELYIAGTPTDVPAVERNGRTDVPTGEIVWLEPDQFEGNHFNFVYWGEAQYPRFSGSYPGDGNGTSVRFNAIYDLGCNDANNIGWDNLTYTLVLLNGQLSLTMGVSDGEIVTECKEFLTAVDVDVSIAMACVDGVPEATPTTTVTETKDFIRGIVCGACS